MSNPKYKFFSLLIISVLLIFSCTNNSTIKHERTIHVRSLAAIPYPDNLKMNETCLKTWEQIADWTLYPETYKNSDDLILDTTETLLKSDCSSTTEDKNLQRYKVQTLYKLKLIASLKEMIKWRETNPRPTGTKGIVLHIIYNLISKQWAESLAYDDSEITKFYILVNQIAYNTRRATLSYDKKKSISPDFIFLHKDYWKLRLKLMQDLVNLP